MKIWFTLVHCVSCSWLRLVNKVPRMKNCYEQKSINSAIRTLWSKETFKVIWSDSDCILAVLQKELTSAFIQDIIHLLCNYSSGIL